MQQSSTCLGKNSRLTMAGTITVLVLVACVVDFTSATEFYFHPKRTEEMQQQPSERLKGTKEMQPQPSEPLSLSWGIADATAYVGKLFTYTLPNDAFQGNVVRYHVTQVDKDALPSFLDFNSLKAELQGVPGPQDKGRIYLEVVAVGDDNSKARDVFSIEVRDNMVGPTQQAAGGIPKPVSCNPQQSQTIMTLIVDCDYNILKPMEKVKLLDNLVGHLNLGHDMLTLLPVGQKPMFDSRALVDGPGNVQSPKSAGSLLSWVVGCGSVEKDHMDILQFVESSTKNGDMTSAIGHDIIGWHVTNTRFQERHRKRRAAATATPTMTLSPPTKTMDIMTDQATKTIAATSVVIMPTKTVEMKPTSVVVDPQVTVQKGTISPSSAIEMSKTMDAKLTATSSLPDKTFTMTSSMVKTDSPVMPSTTSSTASATKTTTAAPTTTPQPSTKEPLCPPEKSKPPILNKPVKDMQIMAGTITRTKIPDTTFFDCYNNATSDLTVEILFRNNSGLPEGFWLQTVRKVFRPYVILSNPLQEHVGRYRMKMVATNIMMKSTSFNFDIHVKDSDTSEAQPNHELSMTMDNDYDDFMSSLDNRIDLSRKVSNLFGDRNSNSLTVLGIKKGSVIFSWTNNSVPTSGCPVGEITQLVDKMMNSDGSMTEEAIDSMKPYKLTSAASVPLGSCENNPAFPTRSSRSVKVTTPVPTPAPTTKMVKPTTPAPTPKKIKPSTPASTQKRTNSPSTKMTTDESTKPPVAAAGAGSGGGSDIWITTVVPAIVVVIVLIIALIIACCLYRKKRKGKMKLEEQNGFAHNKGVPVIFADEYDEKPNESLKPLIMEEEKPPMPPPEYQRASSETSGNSNSTQPIEDRYHEEIEMDDTDVTSPLYSPPPPVTATNHSKPHHVQSSRGLPPPYVPP